MEESGEGRDEEGRGTQGSLEVGRMGRTNTARIDFEI